MDDLEKLKRLIHYVAWKAGKQDWFGATKLYKVLWFADARRFVLTKHSITGAAYIREKYGPVPKYGATARVQLQKENAIRETKEGDLTRIIALKPPDVSIFTDDELKTVDYWIQHIDKNHTAKSVSEETHDYTWQIAKMGEELPLYAVLASRINEPTDEELGKLRKRAESLGLI